VGFGDDDYRYMDFLVPKEYTVNRTKIEIDQIVLFMYVTAFTTHNFPKDS